MDNGTFDRLTSQLGLHISRRVTLGGLGLAALGIPGPAESKNKKRKKRRKRKRQQKVALNDFGCVNVGAFCQNNAQCCSGICAGSTDKKTCQAHDTRGCQFADDSCSPEGSVPCPGDAGGANKALRLCFQTTGNAGFCGIRVGNQCVACAKDADCVAAYGAGAACIVCANDCEETNHTTCIPAEI